MFAAIDEFIRSHEYCSEYDEYIRKGIINNKSTIVSILSDTRVRMVDRTWLLDRIFSASDKTPSNFSTCIPAGIEVIFMFMKHTPCVPVYIEEAALIAEEMFLDYVENYYGDAV